MDLLVTYDIGTTTKAGERRLAKVAKICEGFGVRVQNSVFECRLPASSVEKLKAALSEVIEVSEDSIRFYKIVGDIANCRESLGDEHRFIVGESWIL
jgi:CRISPR-associated protein Cas2